MSKEVFYPDSNYFALEAQLDKVVKEKNQLQSQLAAAEERYKELRETVLISCHPPIDCNDAEVLKIYMLACFEVASKEEVKPCGI